MYHALPTSFPQPPEVPVENRASICSPVWHGLGTGPERLVLKPCHTAIKLLVLFSFNVHAKRAITVNMVIMVHDQMHHPWFMDDTSSIGLHRPRLTWTPLDPHAPSITWPGPWALIRNLAEPKTRSAQWNAVPSKKKSKESDTCKNNISSIGNADAGANSELHHFVGPWWVVGNNVLHDWEIGALCVCVCVLLQLYTVRGQFLWADGW